MSDFITFLEGRSYLASNGLPSTCYFALSTKGVDAGTAHTTDETLAADDFGEITGTGYARQSQSEAAPVDGLVTFSEMSWSTDVNEDWPAGVRSVVLLTSATSSGTALAAWNIQAGGAARDLSTENTTLRFTPTMTVGG